MLIGADLNEHVWYRNRGDEVVRRRYGLKERKEGQTVKDGNGSSKRILRREGVAFSNMYKS